LNQGMEKFRLSRAICYNYTALLFFAVR
jgi:hypothetical protein